MVKKIFAATIWGMLYFESGRFLEHIIRIAANVNTIYWKFAMMKKPVATKEINRLKMLTGKIYQLLFSIASYQQYLLQQNKVIHFQS